MEASDHKFSLYLNTEKIAKKERERDSVKDKKRQTKETGER